MRKIVYFDEDSATDYLVIQNGGSFLMEDLNENKIGGNGEVKVGAKLKSLFNSLFIKGDASIDSNIGVYTSGENLIKTTITNTTLSDFLDILMEDKKDICCLENFQLEIMKNSIAYFQTITPYLGMAEGNFRIDDNLAISINRIYEVLKLGKGYYELIGKKEDQEYIFRFNNSSFKNNYGITDLLQMDLKYYGIQVGKEEKEQLDFTKMFGNSTSKTIIELSENDSQRDELKLPIYDIILAGVE